MEYQALYRQFRPETFGDLVGQEAIVTALKHQLENGKCAHAYLFCGTRGTGKTTTARLLARAVNCENPQGAEPCNVCAACKSIKDGTAIDVVEIDAASNTSVDNVRQIREEITYPPMALKKKVYIIDEVHMLSGGAFNALLKTLEEPPEYAMFILATTEYHKVPATILSRCQRFDFKRISGKMIAERLKYVCDASAAAYEEAAISSIAYAADGSMRDGLSILEKCLSFSNEKLTKQAVESVLGTVDDTDLFRLSSAIAEKNAGDAVSACEKAIADGRDPLLLTTYLMEHFRCLMVAALVQNPEEILQMNAERTALFTQESQKFSLAQIITILKSLTNVYKSQKETPNPKMMLEIGVAAICAHGTRTKPAQPAQAFQPAFQPEISAPAAMTAPPLQPEQTKAQTFVPAPQAAENDDWQQASAKSQPEAAISQSEPPEQSLSAAEQERLNKHGNMDEIIEHWTEILEYLMREKKLSLCANLRLCRPMAEKENVLMLIFRPENKANHDLTDKQTNKEVLQEAIWQYTGLKPTIHCCYTNESAAQAQQVQPAANAAALEAEFGDFIKFED